MRRSAPIIKIDRLSWYIDNTVDKELLLVPGLAHVDRNGGVNREIRDPLEVPAQGMTASTL